MTKRKLLLDSCVAGAVAARLRADGHDVLTVSERGADPGDAAILGLAVSERRILVTLDADFGTLVFRDGAPRVGVLRLRAAAPKSLAERTADLLDLHGDALEAAAFVTDDGKGARISRP